MAYGMFLDRGIEPASPALAGELSTTVPPEVTSLPFSPYSFILWFMKERVSDELGRALLLDECRLQISLG